MIRLLAVAVLLTASVAPAFACDWNKSAAADTRSNAVASRFSNGQATPPQDHSS